MSKETRLLEKIRSGDAYALEDIYSRYRSDFLAFAANFSISAEDAQDIYQDAVIVLYENIMSGKLKCLSSTLKTYLFAIGKYQIYNTQKVVVNNTDISLIENLVDDSHAEGWMLREAQIKEMEEAYRHLGDKCREILRLFYYESLSIDEIRTRLGYQSKDVVKSQKSRCIRQIKDTLLGAHE